MPVLLLSVLLISGCYTSTHTTRTKAFYPDANIVQLRINMSDFEMAGETEISVSYFKYFGFITVIKEVNGEDYNKYNKQTVDIEGVSFGSASKLDLAAIKVIEEYPRADYYYVVFKKRAIETIMFLGKEITETALIRVYNNVIPRVLPLSPSPETLDEDS